MWPKIHVKKYTFKRIQFKRFRKYTLEKYTVKRHFQKYTFGIYPVKATCLENTLSKIYFIKKNTFKNALSEKNCSS